MSNTTFALAVFAFLAGLVTGILWLLALTEPLL